jgi:hypothetical protein
LDQFYVKTNIKQAVFPGTNWEYRLFFLVEALKMDLLPDDFILFAEQLRTQSFCIIAI